MSNAKSSSAPASGTTWSPGQKPAAHVSETEFLEQQAAAARAAMAETLREIGKGIWEPINRHPLVALTSVAVGGALLGRVVASHGSHHNGTEEPAEAAAPEQGHSLIGGLLGSLLKPLIPNLVAAVASLATAAATSRPQEPSSRM